MTEKNSFTIPVLRGPDNYDHWYRQTRLILEDKGLWLIVNGEEVKPDAGNALLIDYNRRALKAMATIKKALTPAQQLQVDACNNAAEILEKIKELYAKADLALQSTVRRRLYDLQLRNGGNISQFLDEFDICVSQLAKMGIPTSDEEQVCLVLFRLPESLEHILNQLNGTNPKMKDVRQKLLLEESKQRAKNASAPTTMALSAFKPQKQNRYGKPNKQRYVTDIHAMKQGNQPRKEPPICNHCHKPGHTEQRCWHLQRKSTNNAANSNSSNDGLIALMMMAFSATMDYHNWMIDSGASAHMTGNRDLLADYTEIQATDIYLGDHRTVQTSGKGSITFDFVRDNGTFRVKLSEVYYIPQLKKNLFAVSAADARGYWTSFRNGVAYITKGDTGETVLQTPVTADGVYILKVARAKPTPPPKPPGLSAAPAVTWLQANPSTISDANTWHRRLAHIGYKRIQAMAKGMVEGLPQMEIPKHKTNCTPCIQGKATREPVNHHPTKKANSKAPLDLIHTDLCGPIKPPTMGGANYFITLTDDYTRYTTTYLLKTKDEAEDRIQRYVAITSNQHNTIIKKIRSDNGGEFTSKPLNDFLEKHGVTQETSAPYTPQHNGVAERKNRTLLNMVRCMIFESRLPTKFWGEALATATYILNKVPTAVMGKKTPHEAWTGTKPSVSNLRVFGCKAHIIDENASKLDQRTKECIYLGPAINSEGYRLYDPVTRSIINSRNVTFDKHSTLAGPVEPQPPLIVEPPPPRPAPTSTPAVSTHDTTDTITITFSDSKDKEEDNHTKIIQEEERIQQQQTRPPLPQPPSPQTPPHQQQRPKISPIRINFDLDDDDDDTLINNHLRPRTNNHQDPQSPPPQGNQRTQRNRTPSSKLKDHYMLSMIIAPSLLPPVKSDSPEPIEPTTLYEALTCPQGKLWFASALDEFTSLIANQTWEIVPLPDGRRAVGSKWTFKNKRNSDGVIYRHKSRLVAKEYTQEDGIDYEETFAPVAKMTSIRVVLAIAVAENLTFWQMDVDTAFLNGKLEEEIYMEQPEGFVDPEHPDWVCRLKRCIYGLKQASRVWNKTLDKHLKTKGFEQTKADPCIYVRNTPEGKTILCVYVDDLLIFATNNKLRDYARDILKERFKMKDIGDIKFILGVQVIRNPKTGAVTLTQSTYVKKILEDTNMDKSKPVSTPLGENETTPVFNPDPNNTEEAINAGRYRNIVGRLIYAMGGTRPDIGYAVSLASRFMANSNEKHWALLKRTLRYLRGTANIGIEFRRHNRNADVLTGYSDSDWDSNATDRRSVGGYVFFVGSCPVSWASKKQKTVALSSTEAEYMAVTIASQEAIWLRLLLAELGHPQSAPTVIFEDNQGAIDLSKNAAINHQRAKHIDIKHHFIRDLVEAHQVELRHCATDAMIADTLTKALDKNKFTLHRDFMNMVAHS